MGSTQARNKEGLAQALSEGGCLFESGKSSTPSLDLKSVLEKRLSTYYDKLGKVYDSVRLSTVEELQFRTATEALSVIEKINNILANDDGAESQNTALGVRDLAELRTLQSLVFKWGIELLLDRAVSRWTSSTGPHKVTDVPTYLEDGELLSDLVFRVYSLLYPAGAKSRPSQTVVATLFLTRHVTDILRVSLVLGWLPKNQATEISRPLEEIRSLTLQFLSILPSAQAITSLGTILSSNPPAYARKPCTFLLGRQLLRPDGVRGLCEAVFGLDDTLDDTSLEKFEHIARVLISVPANTKPETYFEYIVPRITSLLTDSRVPASYIRAASFAMSCMLSTGDNQSGVWSIHQQLASAIIKSILHKPFFRETDITADTVPSEQPEFDISRALSSIITLISNTDPSPPFIANLISPIFSKLYSLMYYLDNQKTSDPTLKESLRGVLVTWGKIISMSEGIDILWSILNQGKADRWKTDLEGHIQVLLESDGPIQPLLVMPNPKSNHDTSDDDFDFDINLFNQFPDPIHFVQYLKSIDRADIASDIFVKLLEIYHHQKSSFEDPMRTMLNLQIIIQMQSHLSNTTTSNILRKPNHILTFIKHVLSSTSVSRQDEVNEVNHKSPLNFSLKQEKKSLDDEDSDDDIPDSEILGPDDEMLETAINLLLSVLEANDDLHAEMTHILNDIFTLLEPLTSNGSSSIRLIAREARMVITARLASSSTSRTNRSKRDEAESVQEIYQKALKLLQDPILPVRAHGLLLLRSLVSPSTSQGKNSQKSMDPALAPALLSIFLQSIQDDDSYIYLNAVQGLVAMADRFGKDVLKGLIKDYADGLEGRDESNITQTDVDVRLRVGEALNTIIKRSGDSLGLYTDLLVPRLLLTVRSHHVPIALRTSSLSLLAECVNTYSLAILPYVEELSSSMIDLLQIESERMDFKKPTEAEVNAESQSGDLLDSRPMSTNSKLPLFRRAALHLLAILIRETTKQLHENASRTSSILHSSGSWLHRLRIILRYISSTDKDNVAKMMAGEAKEGLEQLQKELNVHD